MCSERRVFTRLAAFAVTLAVIGTACGGSTLEASGGGGSQTIPETGSAGGENTEGTVAAPSAVATAEELPSQNSAALILDLVAAVHGPTDDISGRLNTLVPFPSISTPAGANILDLNIYLSAEDAGSTSDYYTYETLVAVPAQDDLLDAIVDGQVASGWSKGRERTDGDRRTVTVEQGRESFDITYVSDSQPLLELRYTNPEPEFGNTFFSRFSGWTGFIWPEGGMNRTYSLSTTYGPGRTAVYMSSDASYSISNPAAADQQTLVSNIEAGITDPALSFSLAGGNYEAAGSTFSDGYDLRIANYTEGSLSIDASARHKFLTPDSGVVVEGVEKPTTPLAAGASADEIFQIISEMHGPTLDIASQMNRVTSFPQIETAVGADVQNVSFYADEDEFGDGTWVISSVEFFIEADHTSALTFYETKTVAAGFVEDRREVSTDDNDATKTTRIWYEAADGSSTDLTVEVKDDVDNANVLVELEYSEYVSQNEISLSDWLGWTGNTPTPDGGRLDRVLYSTDLIFGDGLIYSVRYDYEGQSQDSIIEQMPTVVEASDYTLDPNGTIDYYLGTDLDHPSFDQADVSVVGGEDYAWVTLEAYRRASN